MSGPPALRLEDRPLPKFRPLPFVGGKLSISSEGRDEYFYNDVRETEPGRYTSAYKTMIFDGPGFKSATAVHTDQVKTRVLKLRCTPS